MYQHFKDLFFLRGGSQISWSFLTECSGIPRSGQKRKRFCVHLSHPCHLRAHPFFDRSQYKDTTAKYPFTNYFPTHFKINNS